MKAFLRRESACRFFRCAAICFEIFVVLCVSCLASSITDGCKELSQIKVQEIVERIEMHVTDREPRKTNFDCFAVRQDQYYAIGYNEGLQRNYDEIAVFDASGRFLYSIGFINEGSFSLMWEGDTLLVHHTRSGYVYKVDQNGACNAIFDSDDDYEISERFRKKSNVTLLNKDKTCEQNGYHYVVSTSKIERTDPSGQTVVLYKASSLKKWFMLALVIIFPIFVIWRLFKAFQEAFKKE